MSHTPGPWQLDEFAKDIVEGLGRFAVRHSEHAPGGIAITVGGLGDEQVANARLIAAAPELLEALEACLAVLPGLEVRSWPPGHEMKKFALAKARAAISKATEHAKAEGRS